jgi:hypothetical protein
MSEPDADATRRAYWSEQFDAAYRFMFEAILPYPVAECGEPLVSLQQATEAADVSVQFSPRPHVNGLPRLCCTTCAMARSPDSSAPPPR